MTPFVCRILPKEDIVLFEKIREVILSMRDINLGVDKRGEEILLSCHMLAISTGKVFRLRVRHGFFSTSYQHSWVLTPNDNIIDPYPVGMLGGPLLVESSYSFSSPGKWLYKNDPKRIKTILKDKEKIINKSVTRIIKEMSRVHKK